MAKASRSKKQPAFDANELADLIYSPAVGTGVGSHLLADSYPEGKSHTGGLLKASSVAAGLLPLLSAPLPDASIGVRPTDRYPEGKLHIGITSGILKEKIANQDAARPTSTETAHASDQNSHPEGDLPLDVSYTQVQLVHEINKIEIHPEGNLHIGVMPFEEFSGAADRAEIEAIADENSNSHPEGNLPIDVNHKTEEIAAIAGTHPEGNSPIGLGVSEERIVTSSVAFATGSQPNSHTDLSNHPEGKSPPHGSLLEAPQSTLGTSGRKTASGLQRHPQGKLHIGVASAVEIPTQGRQIYSMAQFSDASKKYDAPLSPKTVTQAASNYSISRCGMRLALKLRIHA
jgi:hypothetical protein